MHYTFSPDIREIVEHQMSSGRYSSEDQLLREALGSLAEADEDLAAIQVAIDELDAGDLGTPYEEVFDRIQAKHSISAATR